MQTTRRYYNKILAFITLMGLITIFSSSFLACGKKKSRKYTSNPAPVVEPVEEEEEEEEVIEVDKKSETVGEPVDPITDDEVTELETENSPAIKHLIFETSDSIVDRRYLSEFLLVVRAAEKSCIKLKMRPSEGLANDSAEDITESLGESGEESTSCDFSSIVDKKDEEDTDAEDDTGDEETARFRLSTGESHQFMENINFIRNNPPLRLANNTYTVCSKRLFRMPRGVGEEVGQTQTLEKIASKTGVLVKESSGKRIRVWVDEEIGLMCPGASPVDFDTIDFSALIQDGRLPAGHRDQLTLEHITNIAEQAEAMLKKLEASYGSTSDVDENKFVDLFISPEVNRSHFVKQYTSSADHFMVNRIARPFDLGYYDASKNPGSNEGEVVYLWAPDPAGLYRHNQFPSSNSLTGNYAKGFVASQIMNLIIYNARLIEPDTINHEAPWLTASLSYLASGYMAGIDYTRYYLGEYITARHHNLSLNGESFSSSDEYDRFGNEEQGYLTMFGWYLHAALCGNNVTTCAKIKDIITSESQGETNLEEIFEKPFKEILANFGLSVGAALTDNPNAVYDLWENSDDETLPDEPIKMPGLVEIFASAPPQTHDIAFDASAAISGNNDPSYAGAFPSKDMLLFQPIFPDNTMDFELAANSVTYILVTGLVQAFTDVTVVLGKKLNVAILPLGDRNNALRKIHSEKLSETAHLDLRPVNLTETVDATKTNYRAREYATDFSVTALRELWLLGSIDNFNVSVAPEGTATIGDTDSYAITIKPCEGAADQTACAAKTHRVMVQIIPRDFKEQLFPMFFATTTELGVFSGSSLLSRLDYIYPEFELWESEYEIIPITCQSHYSWDNTTAKDPGVMNCANGGIAPDEYADYACNQEAATPASACDTAGRYYAKNYNQAIFFGFHNLHPDLDASLQGGFAYDNFFHSSPLGFPYLTQETRTYTGFEGRQFFRTFMPEEIHRQFFNYSFNIKKEPHYYLPFAISKDISHDRRVVTIDNDTRVALYDTIVNGIATQESFEASCSALGLVSADACSFDYATANGTGLLVSEILNWIYGLSDYYNDGPKRIICPYYPCNAENLTGLLPIGTYPNAISATTQFLNRTSADAPYYLPGDKENFTYVMQPFEAGTPTIEPDALIGTYYKPSEPKDKLGYCTGGPALSGESTPPLICQIDENSLLGTVDDIRMQFNVPAGSITRGLGSKAYSEYAFFYDPLSWRSYVDDSSKNLFWWEGSSMPKDRDRDYNGRMMWIEGRKGEVVGKEGRLHHLDFSVPGDQNTDVHLMIGGKDKSTGKYLMRVRIYAD